MPASVSQPFPQRSPGRSRIPQGHLLARCIHAVNNTEIKEVDSLQTINKQTNVALHPLHRKYTCFDGFTLLA
jgi:hypothetical protein